MNKNYLISYIFLFFLSSSMLNGSNKLDINKWKQARLEEIEKSENLMTKILKDDPISSKLFNKKISTAKSSTEKTEKLHDKNYSKAETSMQPLILLRRNFKIACDIAKPKIESFDNKEYIKTIIFERLPEFIKNLKSNIIDEISGINNISKETLEILQKKLLFLVNDSINEAKIEKIEEKQKEKNIYKKIEELQERLNQAETENQSKNKQVRELETKVNIRKKIYKSQINKTKDKLSESKTKLQEQNNSIKGAKSKIRKLKKDIVTKDIKHKITNARIKKEKESIEKDYKKLQDIIQSIKYMKENLQRLISEKETIIDNKIKEKDLEKIKASKDLILKKEELAEREKIELEKKKAVLNKEIEDLSSEALQVNKIKKQIQNISK